MKRVHSLTYLEGSLEGLVKEFYGDILLYAVLSGSMPYRRRPKGTDIDLTVVVNDQYTIIPRKELIERRKGFARNFITLQINNGFSPDFTWPGEIITPSQVKDAVDGRGFDVHQDRLVLPTASDLYYLENPDREYRAWRSQIAFNSPLVGNIDLLTGDKIDAWLTIAKFCFLHHDNFSSKDVMKLIRGRNNKWEDFGISPDYELFEQYEKDTLVATLKKLELAGYISFREDLIFPNKERLGDWEIEVVDKIMKKKWVGKHLYTIEDIRG